MRIVIQRVNQASVTVEGKCIGSIKKGLLIFLGVGQEDTEEVCDKYINKLLKLRIFADKEGKTNLSIQDVQGEILIISQFTLYADCKKGNRPSFTNAAKPNLAEELYEYAIAKCRESIPVVETGKFGADMKINLENDGPFTIVLDEHM